MKKIIPIFISAVFFLFALDINSPCYSQSINGGELMIVNNTGTVSGKFIKINIYPVGAVFSGGKQYTLDATNRISDQNKFIFGYSDILDFNQNLNEQTWTSKINFDADGNILNCKTSLGYGKYRIDFYEGPEQTNFLFTDYCIIDYSDANYGTGSFPGEQKIRIDYNTSTNITFNFLSSTTPHNINEVGKQIRVWEQFGSGFPAVVPSKGIFTDTSLAHYHNFPIDATLFGASDHLNPGDFGLSMTVNYQGANVKENNILNFDHSSLTINEGITFTVNPTQELKINGAGAMLITKDNSLVMLPDHFSIKITDSANISATGSTFTKSPTSVSWSGIRLVNIGSESSISGCAIAFADTAVSLVEHHTRPFIFKDNNIKTERTELMVKIGFYARNSINILIQGNTFNFPLPHNGNFTETAVHIANFVNTSQIGRAGINILENNFYNGRYQVNVLGYASNLVRVTIKSNNFIDGNKNIVLRKCTGDIKLNFVNNTEPILDELLNSSIVSFQSIINFYSNKISYPQYNLISGGKAYSNLAPITGSDNTLVWTGGHNVFSNVLKDNIYSDFGGYVFLNEGRNNFRISGPPSRHIFGLFDDTCTFFNANNNCWYGNNNQPVIAVFKTDLYIDSIPYQAVPSTDCIIEQEATGFLISENDFNINDTLFVTNGNPSSGGNPDEILYAEIIQNMHRQEYDDARNDLKNFIEDYPNSLYMNTALYKIFECYNNLDNMEDQGQRNLLYQDLKSFLENKIVSYQNNDEFVKVAYDIVLMCGIIKREYEDALAGYEYLAYNEPEESLRLLAASDYLTVSSMINGSGGGSSKLKKNMKFTDRNPVNQIVKQTYEKVNRVRKFSNQKNKINNKNYFDTEISEILNYRNKSSVEKINKVSQDAFSFLNKSSVEQNEASNSESSKDNVVSLQNYPNPFNPSTRIHYNIPRDGIVKIEIYNSIGQKIKDLVNEFRTAGDHTVEFDGSEFSSGVYYYKIETNNLVLTKKMLLLK